jgi:hypothetical protein
MRLTDVEDALGASPPEPQTHHAPQTGATISAAYLTNVPPYETSDAEWWVSSGRRMRG